MSIDVSVIMPLYNAKDYVKLAVDSVLNQTLTNIEVVIVDDCSTDGSLELCQELYRGNERVKILKQPRNTGPGEARNTAIRSAKGEYVAFIDSDDEVVPDNYQKMFEAAKKYDADVVHNTHMLVPLDGNGYRVVEQMVDRDVALFPMLVGSKNSLAEEMLLSDDLSSRLEDWKKGIIPWSVCNKMIRRSFLVDNGIFFPETKIAEDMVFCFICMFRAKNYAIIPGGGYVYRVLASSTTRGKKTSAHVLRALKAQIGVARVMTKLLDGIPFFKENPDKAVSAVERVLTDVENGFIRPDFQVLGEETLRSDGVVGEFMRENFGDNAPYVEFLFYELHKNYEPVIDWNAQGGDAEADVWKELVKSAREKGLLK